AGLVRRRRVETDISGERTAVPALAGELRPDLVLINDDDLTYAKIRLDPDSMATLSTSIGEFTETLPAALCWAAAWDMCRDAELAARDYRRLVLAGIPSVTDVSVAQTLLRQLNAALHRFTDPAWRETGRAEAATELRGLLERAEPGSDIQLAYVQAFAGIARSPADLALLAGLLDGTTAIDGLVVDTELRWRLLHRLVSRGAAGYPEIAAELDRDPTDAGARHAATCRASVPNPEAKDAAWEQIVSGTLPNATFRAVLAGFADADQPALLAPFQDRYFEVVPRIWRDWTPDMARWFVSYAYPMADNPAVISATGDLINSRGLPPGLVPWGRPGRPRPRVGRPRAGPPGRWLTVRASSRTPGRLPRSSSSTARPWPSHNGIRQFGYWSVVPGRFCGRRSPTASVSDTPIRTAGVRARYP